MPKVIKSNQVNITDNVQVIDVLTKNYFNPKIHHQNREPEDDGFVETDFTEEEQDDDFIDPELIIKNAYAEAESIVANANAEADLIIQKSKLMIEEEKEQAIEAGFNQGYEDGRAEAEQAHTQIMDEARMTLDSAYAERAAILESIEEETINLVVNIADKIIGSATVINPQVILYIMRCALADLPDAKELTVRVSKDDYAAAEQMKDELLEYIDSDTHLTLVKDTALNPGDCLIDTPIGSIDSSLDKQWLSLKHDLFLLLRR